MKPMGKRVIVELRGPLALAATIAAALLCGAAQAGAPSPAFPLKDSDNGRYLVDQNGVPFLMTGDSPQAMIGNLSLADAEFFMDNRAKYGVNTLWINLLCNYGTACNADGTTYDGIAPFTTPGDLSTPNPAYFDRAAQMIDAAAARGMLVLLDPIETIGWLDTLDANGKFKAKKYGRFLATRFANEKNIVWMSGNDFQTWRDQAQNLIVRAVADGIHGVDAGRLHTVELNYYVSASMQDSKWRSLLGLDAVYTYRPTYAMELKEYTRADYRPTFLVEANYEFEHNGGTDGGTTQNLRRQEYWSALSGTTGQLYGSAWSWRLTGDWKNNLDTVGIEQLSYMRDLFAPRAWQDLVPDRDHTFLVKGYGQFSKTDPIPDDTYATAAKTPDGSLAMAYVPSARTVKIDLAQMSGPVHARWFDPTNAAFADLGSFPNSGVRAFASPGPNHDGDGDWVLLLEAN